MLYDDLEKYFMPRMEKVLMLIDATINVVTDEESKNKLISHLQAYAEAIYERQEKLMEVKEDPNA